MDAKEVWDCESHKQSAPVYKRVCLLGGKESVELVEKLATGRLYVRKTLLQYDREVYETLKQKQIPGIPQIESLTYLPDRLIVMEEYVEGQSLYTHLQSHLFTPMEALDIFRKLEKILSALHGLHPAIIHRDIKPGNVLLTPSGEVYLIDFNAARQYMPEKTEDTVILGACYDLGLVLEHRRVPISGCLHRVGNEEPDEGLAHGVGLVGVGRVARHEH